MYSLSRAGKTFQIATLVAAMTLLAPAMARADAVDEGTAQAAPAPASGDTSTTPMQDHEPKPAETAPTKEPSTGPKPAANFTGIYGRVIDGKTGEPLIEATVKIVSGGTQSALTDIDGYYKLRLAPGTYDIRVFYEVYQARRISGIEVAAKEAKLVNVGLGGDEKAVQEVVVEARADKRSTAALLQERKKSAVVSDAIGAQEISKSPDSAAADAVKRIPSATIRDGKFLFIRGLGGRYSSALLNRTEIPSPEPDEPSVPLDLFPTSLLANLNVVKTYSADLPGNFSGGALLIETNDYPSKFELKLKATFGYNSESTFRQMRSYNGGRLDWLGFDDGSRSLPALVPRDGPVKAPPYSPSQVEQIGESFRNVWSSNWRRAVPNLSLSATLGGTRSFGQERKLGYLVSLNYGHADRVIESDVALGSVDDTGKVYGREKNQTQSGIESAQLGGLVNLGLTLGKHELSLLSFYTHATDTTALVVNGFSTDAGTDFDATRLQFVARGLSFTQLKGRHQFVQAHNLELTWQTNFSYTTRDEPDTRDTTYNTVNDIRRFRSQPQSGERFFSNLQDRAGGASFHLSVPWKKFTLSAGGSAQVTSRRFDARRFRFVFEGSDPSILTQSPEMLFAPANIGPSFELQERTLQADSYSALMVVGAPYATLEWRPLDRLRILGGLRYEVARQTLTPGSKFALNDTPEPGVNRLEHHPLPSANIVYALTKNMNLRAAYSYTLARPRFRELAPFFYYDFVRRRGLSGNPNLETTRLHNVDLRWEWFPQEGSVFAASAFYKYFERPIEQVIISVADGASSFQNAGAAHLVGGEIEARTTLAFLNKKLRELHLGANLSLIYSKVQISKEQIGSVTSTERPLAGQSPYVVNLNFGWSSEKTGTDLTVFYNVYGPRITEVGFQGLPDIYEQPFHRLDFTFAQRIHDQLRVRVTATNLAYNRVRLQQGALAVQSYQPGVSINASVEWSPY